MAWHAETTDGWAKPQQQITNNENSLTHIHTHTETHTYTHRDTHIYTHTHRDTHTRIQTV